jgi:osmotically-inducible protein OsmY
MKQSLIQIRPLAVALATVLVVACAATPTRESTGEFFDDSLITSRVKTALVADQEVRSLGISVETFKGTVQLSGFADSTDEKAKAADIASRVPGVKSVKNDLLVKSTDISQR